MVCVERGRERGFLAFKLRQTDRHRVMIPNVGGKV